MKNKFFITTIVVIGIAVGFGLNSFLVSHNSVVADALNLDEQEATVRAIQKVMPAVVSIIVYDDEDSTVIDLETGEQTTKTEEVEKGRGTGFIINKDGLIATNKHVVNQANYKTGKYRIILNSGKKYYAQYIGVDRLNDLAILKIFDKDLPYVELGNSDNLKIGSTVIAIGNILGKYQNSATKGIVSGLERSLTAFDDNGFGENLEGVIQTDAQINLGNSGGPLINLEGKVVGVNVAIDEAGSAIGFAIPINDARVVIQSVLEKGYIARPYLGVRYITLNSEWQEKYDLPRNTGAWIIPEEDEEPSIMPDGPAVKTELKPGDIIFEINAIKIDDKNTLYKIIQKYKPGDMIGMKVQRDDRIFIVKLELGESR